MRRREFTASLLLATAMPSARAEEPAKQHRIAIVVPAGLVADISDTGNDPIRRREYQAFFEELRRLGDVEGQNLTIERYSGDGRREAFGVLAREVMSRNPDLIVAHTNPVAQAVHAASGTIPIVWIGVDAIRDGLVTSLARPGGNITGVNLSGESACRSSRKPSHRHPKSHSCVHARHGKVPLDNSFTN
jgi:putative ABC transport system substrate-binding protein